MSKKPHKQPKADDLQMQGKSKKPKASAGKFTPGQSGNPAGKRPGTRNHASRILEAMLDDHAEQIAAAFVKRCTSGSVESLKSYISIMLPPRRQRQREPFHLGSLETLSECLTAQRAVALAHAEGTLDDDHAEALGRSIGAAAKLFEGADLESRLTRIEAQLRENANATRKAH